MKKNIILFVVGLAVIWIVMLLVETSEPGEDCTETDSGLDYFNKGIAKNSTHSSEDYCQPDLGCYLYEATCAENKTIYNRIDCKFEQSFCYHGQCVPFNQDTDGDGLTDFEELTLGYDQKVTDPGIPNEN